MSEDDETIEPTTSSAGERLRVAREEKGLSLEDLASQTRIPLRHLQSLEQGDWSRLPAPTYTIGFAKSYASAVGLDRNEIAEDLRAEMGGLRADSANAEVFQPADPGRTMPKWLVLAAIGGIVVVVLLLSWLNERSLQGDSAPSTEVAATEAPQQQTGQPPAAQNPRPVQASGPVTLTATEPAWIQVKDGASTLFEGVLNPGQNFQVPPNATAPILKAGKPEALRITVGSALAPPVGPPGRVASNVSLAPADLMRGGAGASTGGTATVPAPSAPPGVQNTVQ
jgi:cytoskeleton protein RodZ